MKEIEIMSEVKNRNNPYVRGLVVEKKHMRGEVFYRVLWDNKWDSGDAKFYQHNDIEIVSKEKSA